MKKRRILCRIAEFMCAVMVALIALTAIMHHLQQTEDNATAKSYAELTETGRKDNVEQDHAEVSVEDWDALLAINPEIVGWLELEHPSINFPVVQPAHDTTSDYYLKHDFWNHPTKLGCPFVDKRVPKDSKNILIYGHNLSSGKMFSALGKSYQQEAFNELGEGSYITKDNVTYQLKPLMSLTLSMYNQEIQRFDFITTDELQAWLLGLSKLSTARSSVNNFASLVNDTEQVVTLITCKSAYVELDQRTIVVYQAKLITKYEVNVYGN